MDEWREELNRALDEGFPIYENAKCQHDSQLRSDEEAVPSNSNNGSLGSWLRDD